MSTRFQVWAGTGWEDAVASHGPLCVSAHGRCAVRRASIYFIAALLSVAKQQCPANDGAFGSDPHRHPVSHLLWGDRVKDADHEDRVMVARRHLLEAYRGGPSEALGDFDGLAFSSPLGGQPRKLTSGFGEPRPGRFGRHRRKHKGVDFHSRRGEPVYAIADGDVQTGRRGFEDRQDRQPDARRGGQVDACANGARVGC